MTLEDSPRGSLTSTAEKRSSFDPGVTQPQPHSPLTSRHVPLDYFPRNKPHTPSPELGEKSSHDQSGGLSATATLIGDDFHFDKFLEEKLGKAEAEGISARQTGVVFKVMLSSSPSHCSVPDRPCRI